ncbi:MAG TPA: glutathionylspermidine synthase family protein [Polyangia bacterium]|nr:glutathionylspermidine synthase family protein [Polyangia bacterium]
MPTSPTAPPALVASYADFAATLLSEGIVGDPWVDGVPRFRMTPLLIDRQTQRALYAAAESVASLHELAARLCAADPVLLRATCALPPAHQLMWRMRGGWHGIARADVFLTADGPRVCELNSDTPSGQPEATALARMMGDGAPLGDDPNRELAARVTELVERAWADVETAAAGLGRACPPRTVAIVYPTEIPDDLPVIELYARWFQQRGFRVVLGSPFNLHDDGAGGVAMFGVPCPVVWRHYKTDWWGERRPIWRSEPPYADGDPLWRPLSLLAAACARGRCRVINPFGAVLTQNKRLMALMWEAIDRFSARARALIRRYVPPTYRMEAMAPARLRAERARWVLKSDYGCEGEEVLIGAETSAREWSNAIADALPGRWIVQQRFEALPLGRASADRRPTLANFGVYVVAGRAAGLFTRLAGGATDRTARAAATLVRLT